jgi:hypothetical protein
MFQTKSFCIRYDDFVLVIGALIFELFLETGGYCPKVVESSRAGHRARH